MSLDISSYRNVKECYDTSQYFYIGDGFSTKIRIMEGNIKSIITVNKLLLFLVSSAEKIESTTIKSSLISFLRNLLSIYKYL